MDTSMWNEETKKPRKSKKKSAEVDMSPTALQQPIPSITSTPTLNVTLDWLKPRSSHDAHGHCEDCEDVPDDEEYVQNVDYEIISSHNDASLNLFQKIVRWIQPEKIRIIEPKGSHPKDSRARIKIIDPAVGPDGLARGTIYGYEVYVTTEGNTPGVVTSTDEGKYYKGYKDIPRCTPVIYHYEFMGFSDSDPEGDTELKKKYLGSSKCTLPTSGVSSTSPPTGTSGASPPTGASGTSGVPSTTLPPTNVNGYELNLTPEGNSTGVILDNHGNYLGYQNIPKCTPVVYRNHPLGYSSLEPGDHKMTTKLLSRGHCTDYVNLVFDDTSLNSWGTLLGVQPNDITLYSWNGGTEKINQDALTKTGQATTVKKRGSKEIARKIKAFIQAVKDAIKLIVGLLLWPIIKTDEFIKYIADNITRTFARYGFYKAHPPSNIDYYCVNLSISNVIWFIVTTWVFFNWFYIVCFRENGQPVKTFDISWVYLRDNLIIFSLLFKYVVCQVSFFNAIIMFFQRYANFVLGDVWGPKINAILLFWIIYALMAKGNVHIKLVNLFIESCTDSMKESIRILFIVMMFVFALYTFLIEDKVILFLKFASIIGGIFTILLFILRIIWSILIVFVAGILLSVYFIVYSLFGILIYSRASASETVKQIMEYIARGFDKPSPFKYTACRPRTFWEFFVDLLKAIIRIYIRYFFEINLIILFFYNMLLYIFILNDNSNLQNAMVTLAGACIVFLIIRISRLENPPPGVGEKTTVEQVEQALGVYNPAGAALKEMDIEERLNPITSNLARFNNLFMPTYESEQARREGMQRREAARQQRK